MWAFTPTVLRPLQYSSRIDLTPSMKDWYSALPFAPFANTNELDKSPHVVCFPRSLAGLGSMTDQCLMDHDWHKLHKPVMGVGVEAIPCATGRGPMFYRLREEMISMLGLSEVDKKPLAAAQPRLVLLAESPRQSYKTLEQELLSKFGEKVTIKRLDPYKLSVVEQAKLVLQASVYVTDVVGQQSVAAHFLRRGAGIVLVELPMNTVLAGNPTAFSHRNFGYWNNLAYVRARWVEGFNVAKVMDAVDVELSKCDDFMGYD